MTSLESSNDSSDLANVSSAGLGGAVAAHYNNLEEKGVDKRQDSRIFYMRNLNNWIKSCLINEYVKKVRPSNEPTDRRPAVNVLDIGCGKGGDLLKWMKARVDHVVCADIAETSVKQCRDRYYEMKNRNGRVFSAEFHAADCTKTRLRTLYKNPDIQFDVVSCQFAFHYCFESLTQAECMLRNISECLKPGGYFIGTTPDAYDIVQRARETGTNRAANSIYSVTFKDKDALDKIPLFGARYDFHLEGVVDCPEFLVHFPTLTKLAEKFGLMLVAKRRFANYFHQFKDAEKNLLSRMNALETYPPHENSELVGSDVADNYAGAEGFLSGAQDDPKGHGRNRVGTLSKEEWEAATLYIIFAFKKMNI